MADPRSKEIITIEEACNQESVPQISGSWRNASRVKLPSFFMEYRGKEEVLSQCMWNSMFLHRWNK